MPEELKPCPDRMRFRKKVAAPAGSEELKPELLPCPLTWCESSLVGIFDLRQDWVAECLTCHVRVVRPTRAEAIAAWNNRPVSELERLARQVIAARVGVGLSNMLDHLAAFFAEQLKGKV